MQPPFQILGESKAPPLPLRQTKGLEMGQSPPHKSGPCGSLTDGVLHTAMLIHCGQETAIKSGEAILLGFAPDAPFRLEARQIAKSFLSRLLSPCAETKSDIAARDDQVAAVSPPTRNEDVGVRLTGIEVTDCDPGQIRLVQIPGHPRHHVPRVFNHVRNAITMFGRDDETEMMPIFGPPGSASGGIDAVVRSIKELRGLTGSSCALATKVADMRRQSRASQGACPAMARDERLYDDPLPRIEPESHG